MQEGRSSLRQKITHAILKPKQLNWVMFFLLGIGYFSVMSHLETNYFLKSLIVIMPMQVVAIIYVTYLRWSRH